MQTNRVMLIIAVVAGIIAMAAAFGYLRSASGAVSRERSEPSADVLVAATDLPADHIINPANDLKVQKTPARTYAAMVRSAVKADERAALKGRRLNRPVTAGTPLNYGDLVSIADLDIGPGFRAMSITVDRAGVLGGMLVPGDRVDVVIAWQLPKESPNQAKVDASTPEAAMNSVLAQVMSEAQNPSDWGARTLLTDVKVLAINASLSKSREELIFENDERGGGGNSVVTIEVSSEDALDLIRATASGRNRLSLLLRPVDGAAAGTSGASDLY